MGLKNTENRKAIIELLKEMKLHQKHKTAEEIFLQLKKKIARLSFSTVYRNLEKLNSEGLVVKLSYSEGPAYYDANIDPHFHIKCKICGRVDDFPINLQVKFDVAEIEKTGYELVEIKHEFIGICSLCRNKNSD